MDAHSKLKFKSVLSLSKSHHYNYSPPSLQIETNSGLSTLTFPGPVVRTSAAQRTAVGSAVVVVMT